MHNIWACSIKQHYKAFCDWVCLEKSRPLCGYLTPPCQLTCGCNGQHDQVVNCKVDIEHHTSCMTEEQPSVWAMLQ